MKSLSKRERTILVIVLIYSFVPVAGGLLRVAELLGAGATMPSNPRATTYPLPIGMHIVSSGVYCFLGALQFMPGLRRKGIDLHRRMGWAVVVTGCMSALTGLWMTHVYAFPRGLQGPVLYWVRIILGLSMVGFIIWATVAISRFRDLRRHSAAMLRAYAIGQGASTQTVLGIGWLTVVGTEAMGASRDVLMVGAWGVNLLVAEYLIRKVFTPRKASV